MQIYFRPATNGFYATDLHGERTRTVPDPAWVAPEDDPTAAAPLITVDNPECTLPPAEQLVLVSVDDFDALMAAQSAGKQITAGADGYPIAADPAPPSDEQLAATYRKRRDYELTEATALLQRHLLQKSYGQATSLTDSQADAVAAYAQALRDVPQQPDFPRSVAWPTAPDLSDTTTATEV